MSEILFNTIIDKVDAQEKKIIDQASEIQKLKEASANQPDFKASLDQVLARLDDLKISISKMNFPEKEMRELSANILVSASLLRKPVKNEILHHHHLSKVIWISLGLFLALCLVCSGWLMTVKSLDQYKANDTKYRYMKANGSTDWKDTLYEIDSLYFAKPDMRKEVLQKEDEIRKKLEMLQRANEMEQEAKELKTKAGEKKRKSDSLKVNPGQRIPGKNR